jgi:hypothetical protein
MASFIFARCVRKNGVTAYQRKPWVALLVAVAFVVAGCGKEAPPPAAAPPPGDLVYRAGAGGDAMQRAEVIPGPAFARPAILVSGGDAAWQGKWIAPSSGRTEDGAVARGATTGFTLGLMIPQLGGAALMFWPAAVGIVAGATLIGAVGGALQHDKPGADDDALSSNPDRRAIAEATAALRPDQLLTKSVAEVLARRTGRPLPWSPAGPAPAPGLPPPSTDADGVLQVTLEVLGLSTTDEPELFGLLLQVRVQAFDLQTGQLRYERVIAHGPMNPMPEIPRPPAHSLDLMAMENAQVYRHQVTEIVRHVARLIAEDPALPVVSR